MSLPPELACPTCLGPLTVEGAGARCPACARAYPGDRGWLDFLGGEDAGEGFGARLMHSRALARVYERVWRPLFVAAASGGLPDYRAEFEHVLSALAPAAGAAIVDLSCGPGFAGRRLAATGHFERVWGLDWSVAMLTRARADNRGLMRLVRGDAGRLPFRTGSLAGAHAGAALHLWPEPAAAIAEVARVLRPGGVLVASTFAHAGSAVRRAAEHALAWAGDIRVYEASELRGMTAAHGLRDFREERRGSLILFWCRRDGAA